MTQIKGTAFHQAIRILLLLAATLAGGCAQESPAAVAASPTAIETAAATPVINFERFSLVTEDGIELEARFFEAEGGGEEDMAVVLAHMGASDLVTKTTDQTSWEDFASLIASQGFNVLTFDFRCYGRSICSEAGPGEPRFLIDMREVINYLHEQGFTRIVCIGASMGGTACANIAMETELIGLGIIASLTPHQHEFPEDLLNPEIPKLFICGTNDYGPVVVNMRQMYAEAPEPKVQVLYESEAHGTNLFHTEFATDFSQNLVDFLEGLR